MYLHPFRRVVFAGVTFLVRYQWGVIGDIVNTKTISTGLVALLMIIMALAPGAMNVTELNDEIDTEYGHESVIDGTANMAGILSWQDDAWDASWTCEGGLALVKTMNWYDFVNSGEDDPHNYTSWGMNLTGAGSYETNNAPEGTWVVTAGLTCTDDTGAWRSAGGQFGDDHMNPSTVNLTNGTTIGDVSFMLIEHGEDMEDEHLFVCGNGDKIAFGKVNNELQDCEDGADEQQYHESNVCLNTINGQEYTITDPGNASLECESFNPIHFTNGEGEAQEDCENGHTGLYYGWPEGECDATWFEAGDKLNWFDCHDGSQVWIDEVNDGVADCPDGDDEMHDDGGEGDCPFDPTVSGSPCEPVETNPCYSDDESPECQDYVMEYCATHEDPACEEMGGDGPTFICGDGTEIPFDKVNNGFEDCADGADEQQYDAAGDPINWFDCHDGSQVWIYQVNDGNEDCPDGDDEPHGDEGDCPFMDGPGSPCDPVETNPCMADGESPECWDYVMEYCMSNDDPACEDMGGDDFVFICGDGTEIPFDKVNNGFEDCEDGADEQQYDAADEEINWFDCYGGSQVWIHQVNDGTEDCPDGDDEMKLTNADEGGMECLERFIEFHLVTSEFGGVNFVFDMVCLISIEQSNQYREYIDMFGDGNGIISEDEIDEFMIMMESCYDEDGTVIECDDSCYEEDGTEMDCDTDDEEWSINGVIMEMYETDMMFDKESIMGTGSITMMTGQSSKHVDLVDGENTVTVKFENLDDYDDGSECFEVQVLPSAFWKPVSVDVSPAEDWEVSIDEQNSQGFNFYGCSTPDTFTAVFTFMGDEHPNGVENLPPICEFNWFMANDTAFEEGHILTEGPDGDVEIELDAGSYMISVWCKDAEMDFIQVKWEAPALNLSNTFEGDGEVNGWVMFMVPPGLSEEIVVPYSWTSEEWTGTGEFIITLDSGEGDGGDVEGDGGGLPGFTSLLTITALLGAVFFLGRRESE
jgi:hypothetical protein